MIEIKCPKCKSSKKVQYIDSNHQELMFEDGKGYTDGIYRCSQCRISFGTWTNFKIEITNHKIEWIEEDEEEYEDD